MVYETGEIDLWCCFCRSSRASYEDGLAYLYTIYETVADPSSLLDILTKEPKGLRLHLLLSCFMRFTVYLVEKPSESNRQ